METTPKAGSPVSSNEVDTITGGAGEGDCLTPGDPGQQPAGDSPWWRVLQDALGNLVK